MRDHERRVWFGRFAAHMQRAIASPLHLLIFLLTIAVWGAWALSRNFDPFSQLVVNTPTTLAEYLFEILVLAAALAAEHKAAQVLEEMALHQQELIAAVHTSRDELLAVHAELAELLGEVHTHLLVEGPPETPELAFIPGPPQEHDNAERRGHMRRVVEELGRDQAYADNA